MFTLYRLETNDYRQVWHKELGRFVVNWGKLGKRSETKTIDLPPSNGESKRFLERCVNRFIAQGFLPADMFSHAAAMIEYVHDGRGSAEDQEKRVRLEDRLHETLGGTGLGVCDGGSMGSGTMEVRGLVVGFQLAKQVIEADLAGTEFADYSRIYKIGYDEEDDCPANAESAENRPDPDVVAADFAYLEELKVRAVLSALCDAFNAHDLDRVMSFFADDCVLEMPRGSQPWGSRFEGRQAVREALASRFQGLPDVHYGNAEHFVDTTANTGMSKWTLTGTTPDGAKKVVNGCDFYTFRDGKVIRKDSYWKIVE